MPRPPRIQLAGANCHIVTRIFGFQLSMADAATTTPEPSTLALAGFGLLGLQACGGFVAGREVGKQTYELVP